MVVIRGGVIQEIVIILQVIIDEVVLIMGVTPTEIVQVMNVFLKRKVLVVQLRSINSFISTPNHHEEIGWFA